MILEIVLHGINKDLVCTGNDIGWKVKIDVCLIGAELNFKSEGVSKKNRSSLHLFEFFDEISIDWT